ncbi:Serine/threonine protein kinase [Lachnospiraceae bacterium XBB1006]|nr:Serine/threonine protein kinase [Lachnospiraceae bacterium XBB1006]
MFYQAERRYNVKEKIEDKYEFLHPIGEGSSSEVYLVRHKELSRLFIYKQAKPFDWALRQHHHEVLVLRNLSFSGIPTLYEFFESPDSSVIVEEYIAGESLQTILLQFISQEQFFHYAVQMISIVCAMHEYPEGPILYLDFKQEHFIIRENKVHIVDFGLAIKESDGCKENVIFGTKQYSAPETITSHVATVQSDIYSLGIVLDEMREKTMFKNSTLESKTRKIIAKMTEEDVNNRLQSLSEAREIFQMMEKEQEISEDKHILSYKIAVVGSQPRIGTTFVATLLTSCLNQLHIPACYRENPQDRWIQSSSLVREKDFCGEKGRRKNFHYIPNFGPFVTCEAEKESGKSDIQVYDMGVFQENCGYEDFQFVVLVAGARPWEQQQSNLCSDVLRKQKDTILVSTMSTRREIQELSKRLGDVVYRVPLMTNPYMPERKICKLVKQIGRERHYVFSK